MQKERLQDEFTSTLNVFQAAQRSAAHKEKEQYNKAKIQAYGDPLAGKYIQCLSKDYYLVMSLSLNRFQERSTIN